MRSKYETTSFIFTYPLIFFFFRKKKQKDTTEKVEGTGFGIQGTGYRVPDTTPKRYYPLRRNTRILCLYAFFVPTKGYPVSFLLRVSIPSKGHLLPSKRRDTNCLCPFKGRLVPTPLIFVFFKKKTKRDYSKKIRPFTSYSIFCTLYPIPYTLYPIPHTP